MRRETHGLACWTTSSVVALAYFVALGTAPGRAGERASMSAWRIGVEVEQQTFDAMSAGDARPESRGQPGVRASVDVRIATTWALSLSARFGGTWLNWTDPIYNTAGSIEDVSWDTRFGLDRRIPIGAFGVAAIGAGVEYGEARSWARTLGSTPGIPGGQDITDEGPHCYRTGGYARLMLISPTWHRTALCAQVSESFYGCHAVDPTFGTKYDWLGRSLALSVGLSFEIGHRPLSEDRPSGQ